jgi:hypothetical protein
MSCGYEAPTWAHYPDGRCIDGYLWDLDSGDGEFLTSGGDVPCPACNTIDYIQHCGNAPSGNARQRRRVVRIAARKVRLWAMRRSSFPCGVGVGGGGQGMEG